MSDTLLSLLAQPKEYDPFTPLAKMAQAGQANAATQGQLIQNQGAGLNLQLQQAQVGPYLAALAGQGGQGSAPQNSLAAMANSPAGGSTGGAPGQSGLATAAAPGAGASGWGDIGQARFGVPMPLSEQIGVLQSKDQAAAIAKISDTRRQILYSTVAGASDPQSWNAGVQSLQQQGWLSSLEAQHWYNRFDLRQHAMASVADPNAGLSATTTMLGQGLTTDANGNPVPSAAAAQAKGNMAGAESDARNQSTLQYQPQIDQAENGPLADRAGLTARATLGTDVTKAQAAPYNLAPGETRINPAIPGATNPDGTNQPARGVDLLNTGAIPPSAYAARVNSAENSTGNPAAKNPNSSATGNGQFTTDTWLSTIRQARPDLAGQSDQQLLALRSVPAIAAQMTAAYGQQNAGVLQQAGLPVTSATLGMAHRLGPADAITVMNADPSKPLAAVLSGDVIARNPDLARQIVGSFINGSAAKYGNQPVAFAQPAVATRPAAPPSPGRSPAGGVSPFGPDQTSAAQPVASNPSAPISHADERFPAPGASLTNAANGEYPGVPPAPSLPPGQGYAPAGTLSPSTPVPGGQPQGAAVPPLMATPATPSSPSGPIVTPMPGGGTAVQSPLSPVTLAQQKAQAENDVTQMGTYRTSLLTDAQKAAQSNSLIDTMRTEAQQFAQGGGVNADWRDIQSTMNNWSNLFGGSPFPAVSNVEAFNKAAGQLVREAASTVSPRVGVQELQMVQKTLLSDDTSPQGFQKIADQLQGIADYRIAKSAAASQASGNPNAFEANWNAHVTPLAFIVNRMPTADAQALAVQLNKTEQGKRTLNGIMGQMSYADQAGLFRSVQP